MRNELTGGVENVTTLNYAQLHGSDMAAQLHANSYMYITKQSLHKISQMYVRRVQWLKLPMLNVESVLACGNGLPVALFSGGNSGRTGLSRHGHMTLSNDTLRIANLYATADALVHPQLPAQPRSRFFQPPIRSTASTY